MEEKVMETKRCRECDISFDITDKDLEFYDKMSPSFTSPDSKESGLKKFQIPTPTLCPDCRNRRRLTFRNEGKLYKRKCSFSGVDTISIFSPDKDLTVYNKKIWWGDKWDPIDFGQDFDFSKSFFEQWGEFITKTPFPDSFTGIESENSDYGNHTGKMKNCYMCFASFMCEDVMYGSRVIQMTNTIDSVDCIKCENCYQLVNCEGCYDCNYCINSNSCTSSYFLYECRDCIDCFLCYNLVQKKYCILNKQYTKHEYNEKIKEIKDDYIKKGWGFFDKIKGKIIHRYLNIVNCEDSLGDAITNCKNSKYIYHFDNAENCKFVENGGVGTYNTYDGRGIGFNLHYGYEILDTGIDARNNLFLITCHGCNDAYYSINCYNSNFLFGCSGLRNKEYCIFNKQYSRQEYRKLVPKIIKHMQKGKEWGEFFPSNISPFGYNETVAEEYYPLSKKEVLDLEFNWSDYEAPFREVEKIISASKLPSNIKDIPDDILNWAIECENTKKPFRITKEELEFYRKHDLPIPLLSPEQRHLERIKFIPKRKIYDSHCSKCRVEIKTVFDPEDKKKVYCEECYNKEIY